MDFLKTQISFFKSIQFELSNIRIEQESSVYDACSFTIDNHKIISRKSKITPKKIGQFVTIWKRDIKGNTTPYTVSDNFDFFIIFCQEEEKSGLFIFPKTILIKKRIVTSSTFNGKRGMRIYPSWSLPNNKTALKTQEWQLNYFTLLPINSRGKQKLSKIFLK